MHQKCLYFLITALNVGKLKQFLIKQVRSFSDARHFIVTQKSSCFYEKISLFSVRVIMRECSLIET